MREFLQSLHCFLFLMPDCVAVWTLWNLWWTWRGWSCQSCQQVSSVSFMHDYACHWFIHILVNSNETTLLFEFFCFNILIWICKTDVFSFWLLGFFQKMWQTFYLILTQKNEFCQVLMLLMFLDMLLLWQKLQSIISMRFALSRDVSNAFFQLGLCVCKVVTFMFLNWPCISVLSRN